jgi:hypothetical protein
MMMLPNVVKGSQIVVQGEAERQLTIAAISLRRYRLRHGSLPETLGALMPEFVTALPLDPMSGKPLSYRLRPDGTFVLYSVGEDGQDNGGDPASLTPGKFGLWESRDAVWPVPTGEPMMGR